MKQLLFEIIPEAARPSEVDEVDLDLETVEEVIELMARAMVAVVRAVGEDDDER